MNVKCVANGGIAGKNVAYSPNSVGRRLLGSQKLANMLVTPAAAYDTERVFSDTA
ncbi:MAG: hypothetical protein LKI80_08340 [Sporolactobacillus sp.]|jgi:hypothetical protein|nr:hypothetical protein [Sporolactobacillus sp.]